MKQVWQCDFCSHTNIDKKEVSKHESTCSFSPSQKKCYTCKNYTTWGNAIDFLEDCKVGQNCNDILIDDEKCDLWVISIESLKKTSKNF